MVNGKEEKSADVQLPHPRESPCTVDVVEAKENINIGNVSTKLAPNKSAECLPDPAIVQIQAGKSEVRYTFLQFPFFT